MASVETLIRRFSRRYNIDPRAALAVASVEGGLRRGAVGDQGTSYGPFQLHVGGALPAGRDAAWANSRQGIKYAIRQMAGSGAQGLTGRAAISAIVRNFERPAAPGAEIARALAQYGTLPGAGARGGAVLGDTASAPTSDGRQALAMSLLQGLQSGRPTSPSELVSVFRAGQNSGTPPAGATRGPAVNGASTFGPTSKAWAGSKSIANQLRRGLGLQVTSAKRDTKATATGGVSDHWKGSKTAFAYDLGGPTSRMDTAAVQLAHRLGIAYRKGQPLVATVNMSGYRIQVLYRTNVGGDHFDHIHVGVKRL